MQGDGKLSQQGGSPVEVTCPVCCHLWVVPSCAALSAMLAMQAPPKALPDAAADTAPGTSQQQPQPPQDGSTAKAGATSAPATAASSAAAAAKPVVVLLDVNLEAPVLVLPLDSSSDDNIEVDLGTLALNNLVVWEMRSEDKDRQKLLVDDMQVGWL